MTWSWLRLFRAREAAGVDDPVAWRAAIDALPFFDTLAEDEQQKLVQLAHAFEDDKSWEGCGGLELTEFMRASISIQACLLIMNLSHQLYRRVRSILVYPGAYIGDEPGAPRAGEAMVRGPVVLSWNDALEGGRRPDDGRNVVLHEFAHKLDMLDDEADGVPPLTEREHYAVWRRIVDKEFKTLVHDTNTGRATLLDGYGATSPAEFFAVATECFFERPHPLRVRHTELYELLRSLYNQDPAGRTSARR